MDTVCAIRTISLQLNPTDPGVLAKESAKDPVLAKVMLFTREGWSPKEEPEDQGKDYSVEDFRKISASLTTVHGCLLYGSRVIIPPSLQPQVLESLQNAKNETAGPYGCLLAKDQRGHNEPVPSMFNMYGTSQHASQSSQSPLDGTGKTLEQAPSGSYHQLHGNKLASFDQCLF